MKKYITLSFFLFFSVSILSQEESKILLEKKLSEMYNADQGIRKSLINIDTQYAGSDYLKERKDSVLTIMKKVDKENQLFVSHLLDSIGWPSDLSFQGNMAIFLVIQHSDSAYMNKYAYIVEEGYIKGSIVPDLYAIFKDRILVYANKAQIYGSQIINGYVWPIEDVENVDDRRKKMNLSSMDEYLKSFGSNAITWDKKMTVERMHIKIIGD